MQNSARSSTKIQCPVCNRHIASHLRRVSSKEAAQHFVLYEKYPVRFLELASHIEALWEKDVCEVVQCGNCGFCFSNPYVAGDARFFKLAYGELASYPQWKWEFQETYEVIKTLYKSDFKLMDIGAGDGAFVKRLAEGILPINNITCIEFPDYGRKQILDYGIKCLNEDVRSICDVNPDLSDSFDIICMFQVLQHLDGLDILFHKLNCLLKTGGSLFVALSNPKRIAFNEEYGALLDMPPSHIGRWNIRCFEVVAEQYGFSVDTYKIQPFEFIPMAKQFINYRYLRNAQRKGSFENRIQTMQNRYIRKIMRVISFAVNTLLALPALRKVNSEMGQSQWVHLIKR